MPTLLTRRVTEIAPTTDVASDARIIGVEDPNGTPSVASYTLLALADRIEAENVSAPRTPLSPRQTTPTLGTTFTLTQSHANRVVRLDLSQGTLDIIINGALYNTTDTRTYKTTLLFTDLSSPQNVTFTASGTTLTYTALSPQQLVTGSLIDILVTSTGAFVAIQSPGNLALSAAINSVQTAATRTITSYDLGRVIPSNGISNAIQYTVPAALFTSARSFVCQINVLSVTGGPLTFLGTGGVIVTYYDKNPGVTPYVAGDRITICVDSATTASISCNSVAVAPAATLPLTGTETFRAVQSGQEVTVTVGDIAGGGGAPGVITIDDTDSPFTLLPIHAGQVIRVDAGDDAVDIVVPDALWAGSAFVCWFDVIDATNLISIAGDASIALSDTLPVGTSQFLVTSATTASLVRDSWPVADAAIAALRPGFDVIAVTNYNVTRSDEGKVLYLYGTPNPCNITIDQASLASSTDRGFRLYGRVAVLTNPVTLTFSQPANVTWLGDKRVLNRVGDFFELIVVAGLAIIRIYSSGAPDRLDPLAPTVQAAHTAATRTIVEADAGDIIPVSAASNAVAITIPATLFGVLEAGRAFVCQIKVVSVAGGALTFVGGGGVVLSYYGKNPGTTPYAADDYLTVVVDSATTASVFCASPAP